MHHISERHLIVAGRQYCPTLVTVVCLEVYGSYYTCRHRPRHNAVYSILRIPVRYWPEFKAPSKTVTMINHQAFRRGHRLNISWGAAHLSVLSLHDDWGQGYRRLDAVRARECLAGLVYDDQ